jgi:hypothetical protein
VLGELQTAGMRAAHSIILRPCPKPGCSELTAGGPCDSHRWTRQREHGVRRGTAAERGYDARWCRVRVVFLREHPFCADPFGNHEGRAALAECVAHKGKHGVVLGRKQMAAPLLALQFKEGSDLGRTMGLIVFTGAGTRRTPIGTGVGYLESLRLSARNRRATAIRKSAG